MHQQESYSSTLDESDIVQYGKYMLSPLLNLIFPRSRVDTDLSSVTSDVLVEHATSLRARRIHHLDTLTSSVDYRSALPLQRAISVCKYKQSTELIGDLGNLLLDSVLKRFDETAMLVPVPLHWKRYLERGFNQAVLLSEFVSARTNLRTRTVLKRTRDTGHQAWRSRSDRLQSMKSAFAVRNNVIVPYRIILIDDIATTGATLDACAKVLKEHGASYVEACVIARG